ncbi:MAG: rod-binding protein [Rhodospirillales bacterium]|jgi:Rod binding domain-containing protein|nr:rod-binding protein [Rhodospirillales bacterium]
MEQSSLLAENGLALQMGKAAPNTKGPMSAAKARETAVEFEAFFLGQMMQPMFANISAEKPFGGGHAEKMWRSMMVDEYGKAMAKSGGIGIADQVQREILRMQEAQTQ